ncbi:MAG: hypothetical protein ABI581_11450, partial [Sediminibacterium sp.]
MNKTLTTITKSVYSLLFLLLVTGTPSCKKSGGDPPPGPPPPPPEKTFKNPLLNNAPDPYVLKSGSTYYYTNTLGNRIGIWKTTAMSKLA